MQSPILWGQYCLLMDEEAQRNEVTYLGLTTAEWHSLDSITGLWDSKAQDLSTCMMLYLKNKNMTPSLKNVFKTLQTNLTGHLISVVLTHWLKVGVKRAGGILENRNSGHLRQRVGGNRTRAVLRMRRSSSLPGQKSAISITHQENICQPMTFISRRQTPLVLLKT